MTLDHLSSALPPAQREGRREREIHWATQFLTDSDRVARPPPHYHAWPCAQLCFGAAVLWRKQARVCFAQASACAYLCPVLLDDEGVLDGGRRALEL